MDMNPPLSNSDFFYYFFSLFNVVWESKIEKVKCEVMQAFSLKRDKGKDNNKIQEGAKNTETLPSPMSSETEASSPMFPLASQICSRIASVFSNPTAPYPPPLDLMVTAISAAAPESGRVFLYGVGREGLMLQALCMRLAHLGLSTHFVFDMTTPPISSNDLLIASAGPGGFSTVDALCSVARSYGARVLLLTAQPETGSCVKHASVICYVPAQTMANDKDEGEGNSRALLPMGSVYEGALFVLFEMVIYKLGEVLGQSPEAIRSRHTNLE